MSASNNARVLAEVVNERDVSKPNYQVVNKQQVACSFDNAASKYNALATIQREIAAHGLDYLEKMGISNVANLLDIGCGTASSVARLQNLSDHIMGVDISLNMLQQASITTTAIDNIQFAGINADAESLPIQSGSIDVVYSSMALQWCQSPTQALAEIHRVLKPNGRALLCILTGESFDDLQRAWQHIGLPSRVNKFHSKQQWLSASKGLSWSVKHYSNKFVTYHKNIFEMLGSIKKIGANTKLAGTLENNPSGNIALVNTKNTTTYMNKQEVIALTRFLQTCNTDSDSLALDYQLVFIEINK